jgi:hypothetical protein
VVRTLKEQWRLALPLMALHDLPCGTTLLQNTECTVTFDVSPSALTDDEVSGVELMSYNSARELYREEDRTTRLNSTEAPGPTTSGSLGGLWVMPVPILLGGACEFCI